MPRNGTGTFVLPAGQPVVPDTIISATVFNTFTNDVANGLTTSIATDGQTPMAANLSIGNNRITNVTAGIAATDAVNVTQMTTADTAAIAAAVAASTTAITPIISDVTGSKNILVNSDLTLFTRASSDILTVAVLYTCIDNWFTTCAGGNIGTVAAVQTLANPTNAVRLTRNVGQTSTAPITFGQVLETGVSKKYQGKTVILSFYAARGVGYSGSGVLNYRIATGTGTDQSSALFVSGGWTGYTANAGVADLGITLTRFSKVVTLPANCNQIGISFSTVGAGTAVANDFVWIADIQLEEALTGVTTPTRYERLLPAINKTVTSRYYQQLTITTRSCVGAPSDFTGITVTLPVPMRISVAPSQIANNVLLTQTNVATTTSFYLMTAGSLFASRAGTAAGLVQFSETVGLSAEL